MSWTVYQGECLNINLQLLDGDTEQPRTIDDNSYQVELRPLDQDAILVDNVTVTNETAVIKAIVPGTVTKDLPAGKRTWVYLIETEPDQCGPKSQRVDVIEVIEK